MSELITHRLSESSGKQGTLWWMCSLKIQDTRGLQEELPMDTGAATTDTGQKRRMLRHFLMITSGSEQNHRGAGWNTVCVPLGTSQSGCQQDQFPLSRYFYAWAAAGAQKVQHLPPRREHGLLSWQAGTEFQKKGESRGYVLWPFWLLQHRDQSSQPPGLSLSSRSGPQGCSWRAF